MQSTRAYGEDDPYVNIPITAGMIGFDGVMDLAVPIGCADIVVDGEYGFSIDHFSVSDNVHNHRAATSDCPCDYDRLRGSGALHCYLTDLFHKGRLLNDCPFGNEAEQRQFFCELYIVNEWCVF